MTHCAGSTVRGSATPTVLVFADELAIPVKLQSALVKDREFKLLCICGSRSEVVRRAAEFQPDVMLFWFQTGADLSVLHESRCAAPASAVVLCVPHDLAPETARQATALGVRALVSATAGWETFKQCLRLSTCDLKTLSK